MTEKIGGYVAKYLELRQKRDDLKKKHQKELAPYEDVLGKLEAYFARELDDTGLSQLTSQAGTAYKSTLTSVSTADKLAFLDYVKQHDAWHLLDIRPSKSAINELLEEGSEELPPGVNVSRYSKINVRKS